jgi:YidC/Oxa1 family membrane protein insertase
MDSRRLITSIVLALLVWMMMQQVSNYFWPQPVKQVATTAPATPELSPQTTSSHPATTSAAVSDTRPVENTIGNDNIILGSSARDKTNEFEMQLALTTRGASLRTAQLSKFAESVKDKTTGYRLISPLACPEGTRNSLSTETLLVLDEKGQKFSVNLENAQWFYEVKRRGNDQEARFWIDIAHKDKKLVRVVKSYLLTKKSDDVRLSITVENLTDQNLNAVIRQEGVVGIRKEDLRSEDRKIYSETIQPGQEGFQIHPITRDSLLKLPEHSHRIGAINEQVVWAGQTNKYFAALLAAVDEKGNLSGNLIDYVDARTYTPQLTATFGEDLSTIWVTKSLKLPPKKQAEITFELYAGPKSDVVFSKDPYLKRNYSQTFESSWCTMQWLANFMAWLLNKLFLVSRNYGVAIILLVIIVRVCLHPITKSSQISMMRMGRDMQRLQPKMAAIKEKFKNNREAQNKAVMELYKEEGISPAGQMMGCLPMMLQMPIWVALWTALNNTFALRHQPFVLWIKDLAGPDALVHFSKAIDIPLLSGMVGPIHELNVLPILLMIAMLVQQKLAPQTPPSPDADPAQAKQQKFIFYFMSLFMGLIFYNAPSGLNLYILTSTLLGVVESKRIRKHLEQEEKKPRVQKKRGNSWWEAIQKKIEGYASEYEKAKKTTKK